MALRISKAETSRVVRDLQEKGAIPEGLRYRVSFNPRVGGEGLTTIHITGLGILSQEYEEDVAVMTVGMICQTLRTALKITHPGYDIRVTVDWKLQEKMTPVMEAADKRMPPTPWPKDLIELARRQREAEKAPDWRAWADIEKAMLEY